MKEMAAVDASQPEQEDEQQDKNQKIQQQKPKQRKSGKKLASEPPPLQLTLTYRPQRLSEVSNALLGLVDLTSTYIVY